MSYPVVLLDGMDHESTGTAILFLSLRRDTLVLAYWMTFVNHFSLNERTCASKGLQARVDTAVGILLSILIPFQLARWTLGPHASVSLYLLLSSRSLCSAVLILQWYETSGAASAQSNCRFLNFLRTMFCVFCYLQYAHKCTIQIQSTFVRTLSCAVTSISSTKLQFVDKGSKAQPFRSNLNHRITPEPITHCHAAFRTFCCSSLVLWVFVFCKLVPFTSTIWSDLNDKAFTS